MMTTIFETLISEMRNALLISFAYLIFREMVFVIGPLAAGAYAVGWIRRRINT